MPPPINTGGGYGHPPQQGGGQIYHQPAPPGYPMQQGGGGGGQGYGYPPSAPQGPHAYGARNLAEVEGSQRSKAQLIVGIDFVCTPSYKTLVLAWHADNHI